MTVTKKITTLIERLEREPLHPVWIALVPPEQLLKQAAEVDQHNALPLAGYTFAVKDNIDVAGLPTTAGCPAFAYTPETTAPVVQLLLDAGAVLVGKTNMDQFATGLTGARSPHGACSSIFDERYISGGSSSGSAVAVASGLVDFALGTDTAGSGRVPAAFNNLIGLKPTRGWLSTRGVVPTCRSLDCVSVFTKTSELALKVLRVAHRFDQQDTYSRFTRTGEGAAPWASGPFRFGVPAESSLQFFGDTEAAQLHDQAVRRLHSMGGERVEIDYSKFRSAADLLYAGPWVAERLAAIEDFFASHSEEMNPVVREIIGGGRNYSAVGAFRGEYRLRELCRDAETEWAKVDVLALPTTGTIFTHEQVAAEPVKRNSDLGYYTNFVNLMDLAAVAVPAGFRPNGLPFGISLIGRAHSDEALLGLAERFAGSERPSVSGQPGCIAVAVVGAHLTGQPLNHQLTSRGARLVKTSRTAASYRLYSLTGTKPLKPGLVFEPGFAGPGIEIEVWAVPEDKFGGFVAEIPAPLGIGNATLEDGTAVKCFICEPYALASSQEVTHFGGWRRYLASL